MQYPNGAWGLQKVLSLDLDVHIENCCYGYFAIYGYLRKFLLEPLVKKILISPCDNKSKPLLVMMFHFRHGEDIRAKFNTVHYHGLCHFIDELQITLYRVYYYYAKNYEKKRTMNNFKLDQPKTL
jgi:hypothetical protein